MNWTLSIGVQLFKQQTLCSMLWVTWMMTNQNSRPSAAKWLGNEERQTPQRDALSMIFYIPENQLPQISLWETVINQLLEAFRVVNRLMDITAKLRNSPLVPIMPTNEYIDFTNEVTIADGHIHLLSECSLVTYVKAWVMTEYKHWFASGWGEYISWWFRLFGLWHFWLKDSTRIPKTKFLSQF